MRLWKHRSCTRSAQRIRRYGPLNDGRAPDQTGWTPVTNCCANVAARTAERSPQASRRASPRRPYPWAFLSLSSFAPAFTQVENGVPGVPSTCFFEASLQALRGELVAPLRRRAWALTHALNGVPF